MANLILKNEFEAQIKMITDWRMKNPTSFWNLQSSLFNADSLDISKHHRYNKKMKIFIKISVFAVLWILFSIFPADAQTPTSDQPDKPLIISISRNFSPLTFINSEGNPAGLFADIWKLWAEKTGKKIEFLPSTWSESIENL